METRHFPPQGQTLFGGAHIASPECWCSPERNAIRKRQTSGRGGSGQGYKIVAIHYQHKTTEDS